MNRPHLERSIGRASRAGVFAATVAAAILANSATWSAALAQQPGSVVQQRDEATVGHQQPRIQNLPPSVAQDEKKMRTELDAAKKIVEKLENKICRGC
jgi:hypothetical protein